MQIGSIIRRSALHFKDRPCLVEAGRTVTFRDFDALTDRAGNALLAIGLKPGDRVGVLLPNGIDCLVAYYALAKAGLIRVSMNTRDTLENHAYKVEDSGSRAVIHGMEDPGIDVELKIGAEQFSKMMTEGDATPCAVDRALDEPLRLGYTGGTTGKSKAVTLTTRGEISELTAFLTDMVPGMTENSIFLHAAPIAHASGAFFLPAIVRGACSVVMKKFDPASFIALAEREQADMTFLVPTMLAMILEEPALKTAKLNFKLIAYGASSISPSVLKRGEEAFGRVFAQSYGQAESPMVITCLQPEDHDRIGSCGRPFTCVEAAIFDDDDNPLPIGEVGEIVCRGPQTMAYYWNRPEATKEVFRNGWLHTGDVGRMDEDGFFYIMDRKNDLLVSGGYNVYPREVEDVLLSYEGVIEAAVIGLPDEKWGDRVEAVIVARSGVDPDDVQVFAKTHLANYKCPKKVSIWSELPKSPANKILRREVRAKILEHQEKTTGIGG